MKNEQAKSRSCALAAWRQQFRRRLAVRRVGIVRRGEGMIEGVDIVAVELSLHLGIDSHNLVARDQATPHARLVAHHEKQETRLPQSVERSRRLGKNLHTRRIAEVGHVHHQRVVPVEKNSVLLHATPSVFTNISCNSSAFSVAVPSFATTTPAA